MPAWLEESGSKTGGPPYLDHKCIIIIIIINIIIHSKSLLSLCWIPLPTSHRYLYSQKCSSPMYTCIFVSTQALSFPPMTSDNHPPSPGYAPSSSIPKDLVTQYQVHVRYLSRIPGVLGGPGFSFVCYVQLVGMVGVSRLR